MALTVTPFTDLNLYTQAINWVRELNHKNIFPNNKKLLVKYAFIPGYNVTEYPHFVIYRRKATVFGLPHTLFHLCYGCLSMIIEVPRDNDLTKSTVNDVILPPIPFYSNDSDTWDMSDCVISKDQRHIITLNFSERKDITKDISNYVIP